MAVTSTFYNHSLKLFPNSEVSLSDLKLMLLTDDYTFSAAHTTIDQVAGAASPSRANEVFGNGWTEGGEPLASAAVTVTNTNSATLDAADIEKTATGGAIGPTPHGVIYDDDSGNVLAYVNFDGIKEAGEGTDFKVIWNEGGIIRWSVAA